MVAMYFRSFLCLAIASLVFSPLVMAEYPYLSAPDYDSKKQSEGIMIWVLKDGSLITDSGNIKTAAGIIDICKEWRKQGTEPSIRVLLRSFLPTKIWGTSCLSWKPCTARKSALI